MWSFFLRLLFLLAKLTATLAIPQPIPWTNCSTWTDQLLVESVTVNKWPPTRNAQLSVFVDGVAKESLIYGQYNKTIVYRGYALPSIFGSLDDLGVQLPIHPGPVQWVIWNTTIPEVAPIGNYDLIIKAREQDQAEIFCIQLSFEL